MTFTALCAADFHLLWRQCPRHLLLPCHSTDEDEQFKEEKAVIIREISRMGQQAQEQAS